MASRKVWAFGARRFNSMARVANRMICTVAPDAYQNGPETPLDYDLVLIPQFTVLFGERLTSYLRQRMIAVV
jgi:hypothetical protein